MGVKWLLHKHNNEEAIRKLYTPDLKDADFKNISNLVRDRCGINLHVGKQELVKARLGKRLRTLGLENWKQYLAYLKEDESGDEIISMLDAISTNLTYFFRENVHFEYLAQTVLPPLVANAKKHGHKLRMWSAGCSTGEEPYSLGLVLSENIPAIEQWDIRILSTDISTKVLATAKRGVYDAERLRDLPLSLREKYFERFAHNGKPMCEVKPELRRMVYFARMNFMEPWPMRGPFDLIMCRNVMIYFARETREKMIHKFWELLTPGGTFFIGHSESLAGMKHNFKYIKPAIYRKL